MKKKKLFTYLFTFGIVIIAAVIAELALNTDLISITRQMKGLLIPVCCWICMAVSLNLVVGVSGELSLGHAGFMSVGAFTGAVLVAWLGGMGMTDKLQMLIIAIIGGAITAAVAGVLIGIPVLRLRGDYLAIVTLAFGEIIRNVLNCVYISQESGRLHFGFLNPNLPGKIVVNGPNGATGVMKIATFEVGIALVLLTLFIVLNLMHSRTGRAIMAIRDNRIAAESTGINVTKYRMIAFVLSAALAGMAGALYGLNFSTFLPSKFKFDQSINVLVFVVMGGIGNMAGSVLAAGALTILPEMLRSFSELRMLIYALLLIDLMLVSNNAFVKWNDTLQEAFKRFKAVVIVLLLAVAGALVFVHVSMGMLLVPMLILLADIVASVLLNSDLRDRLMHSSKAMPLGVLVAIVLAAINAYCLVQLFSTELNTVSGMSLIYLFIFGSNLINMMMDTFRSIRVIRADAAKEAA